MASGFNFPPPAGAPNANSSTPLRPYYGSPLDSPLQQYYQHTSQLEEELAAHSELNSQEAARELLSYGMIKYLTLAIATPFENAQTLLQVQYLPNDDGPTFQLAPIEGGVWKTVTDLVKHPTEGWFSLWKGQYTNWVYEILHLFAQPTLEATLNDTFDLYDDTIPLVHLDRFGPNMATMVTSHLVVGLILSPLELVRTRLVVQTADPAQRKYTGMLNCISTIISEEGVSALWGGVNLVPTILYHTLTPLITNSIPLVIDRVFNISGSDSPLLYSVAELGLETLDLLIRLPLETVRKRLQIQIQAKIPGKRYETVVETRKRPYAGVIDCVYKIIQEEGGQHKRLSSKKSDDGEVTFVDRPWYSSWGVRGLYTGLGMHLTSNLAMFVVGAVTNLKDDGDDW
ncbi:MAG: mitochondrial carrier domain-containing protein [Linnemannia gamsii]|nr:MAG: mitochondrial carrier domain-containing protein [Linnemannia gamsii]